MTTLRKFYIIDPIKPEDSPCVCLTTTGPYTGKTPLEAARKVFIRISRSQVSCGIFTRFVRWIQRRKPLQSCIYIFSLKEEASGRVYTFRGQRIFRRREQMGSCTICCEIRLKLLKT